MKRNFSSFLIIVALFVSCFGFSSFASAATPKAVTYYTTQGTHLYKDKKGKKAIRILPTNTKFYLRHNPEKGYYHVTYSRTSGYINVTNLSRAKYTTYKDFEGSWILGNVNTHLKYQVLITKDYVYYNYYPEEAIGAVKSNKAVVKNNTLYFNNVMLQGDGTQVFGKLTQSIKLSKKNGKKVIVLSQPSNKEISDFHGTGIIE
jgi:hypothetical protein